MNKRLCLLLILWSPAVLSRELFDCTVTAASKEIITITCDSMNKSKRSGCSPENQDYNCTKTTYDIPVKDWAEFWEWGASVPAKGQVFKARWGDDQRLEAIEDCESKSKRMIEEYCGETYCRPPLILSTPEDCH